MTDERKYIKGIGWIALVFVVLALTFAFDFWGGKKVRMKHPTVDSKYYSKDPVRVARLKPVLEKDGVLMSCNDCHQNIEVSDVQKSFFASHSDIVLKHGANNYCLTCHNRDDRELLRDINGKSVDFSKSQQTCLGCHGTIYRDWEKGVHGRINGYWNSSKGEKIKLTCVQCHDPHDPAFKSVKPSPPPVVKNYMNYLEKISLKENIAHE